MVIGNMCFAIHAKKAAVSIYHSHGIISHISLPLKKTDWQHYLKFPGHPAKIPHCRILLHAHSQTIGIIITLLAEIPCFKKLRQ